MNPNVAGQAASKGKRRENGLGGRKKPGNTLLQYLLIIYKNVTAT
jgi:hypothetical protein